MTEIFQNKPYFAYLTMCGLFPSCNFQIQSIITMGKADVPTKLNCHLTDKPYFNCQPANNMINNS